MRATGRDPEEYARATERAREVRERTAQEVGERLRDDVIALIVEGDIMGSRGLVVQRVRAVAVAEQRGDKAVMRAAWLELAAAAGQCAAALDFEAADDPPER